MSVAKIATSDLSLMARNLISENILRNMENQEYDTYFYRTFIATGFTDVDQEFTTTSTCGTMGHVNNHPTIHYFGIPRHTQSMIAYKILTEYFWKFQ